ncbi:hypothetical protein VTN77DRAFT_2326 [Rasamsonia byssochlamydoides]|uniref:uncharacterized protein n=1 Tax=Rasamsonia byssochlamydoides TaxID=89139 RepID=UPI0037421995
MDEMEIENAEPRGTKRSATEAGLPSGPPRRIQALDPDVVNKIAAGEIIVAPMHALKELIENSVDAGSTSIEILVKDGGLKLLQITDNGHGIDPDDLPILCERFTTSKLKSFEDLSTIGTYGFRGEALASISHIAHLTVTTKTANSSCAWRAHYSDGKLIPAKPGQSAKPKPTAGRGGTQITVEDLFYNVPTRRRAFRSASEEYAKILDVVGRYAIHCSGVAFSCKKHGDSGVSISTAANSSIIDRIRQIHGSAVANELIEFRVEDNKKLGFKASGYVTNANYHVKRTVILLFINHRSVESSALRKAVEQTYSTFLPKGGHPFAYIDLEIEPQRVDVNVHPTKREVNFLNEDEIIELICSEIRSKLAQVDSSRTFMTQTLLPGARVPEDAAAASSTEKAGRRTATASQKPYEHNLVRTDARMRKITSMLPSATQSRPDGDGATTAADDGLHYETTDREPLRIGLTSVKNLRAAVRAAMHNGLTEMFATHTYVGLVDERRRIAAIQSGVKLYLVDYGMICNEFFYQVGLTDFGNFGVIKLDPAPKLIDLLKIAAEAEREEHARLQREADSTSDSEDIFAQAPEMVAKTLIDRRDMLDEYFSLQISEDGELLSIPLMLKGYVPSLAKLPRFLLRLGPYVNWTSEEECFRTFLRELAAFYTPEQLPTARRKSGEGKHDLPPQNDEAAAGAPPDPVSKEEEEEDSTITSRRTQLSRMLEHVIFPAVRARLVATASLLNGVVEVADLKGLYRVFERC